MSERGALPEIESFNLADLNVSGLDVRLELTTVLPQTIICTDCGGNSINCTVDCYVNSGCTCHADVS